MRIKDLLAGRYVTTSGFKAMEELGEGRASEFFSNAHLSTLPAPLILEKGIKAYFSPRLERGQVFDTAEEILEANPKIDGYKIIDKFSGDDLLNIKDTIIVSRHQGTIDILKDMHPNAKVYSGNVSANDIKDKHVIGNLPPFLIAECALYTPVMIKDFDYTKDGDLKGDELKDRFELGTPIKLKRIPLTKPKFNSLEEVKDFFYSDYEGKYYEVIRFFSKEDFSPGIPVSLGHAVKELGYKYKAYSFEDGMLYIIYKDGEKGVEIDLDNDVLRVMHKSNQVHFEDFAN